MKFRRLVMKEFAAGLAGLLMLAGGALAAQTGTVRCSGRLNVRTAGNDGAPIIGHLSPGSAVSIVGSKNGWLKISWNGGTAWVSGRYVAAESRAQTVVGTARSVEGAPYRFGGASAGGFDCSGLVVYCFKKVGVTLPHSAAQQFTKGTAVSRSSLRAGDLVFFDTDGGRSNITHVGIYLGNGRFVSAQSGAGAVKEASLSNSYWSGAYRGARRVL